MHLLNYNAVLDIFLNNLIPETKLAVSKGNKVFGAFILKKSDLSLMVTGTNNEIVNPLFHGEISTIFNYFKLNQLNPKEYFFICSHEPCSLCLSAITWSGFDNFYYFFPYKDTKLAFNIPHDLKILNEVFGIKNGQYKTSNSYWNSYSILNEIDSLDKNIDKKELLLKSKKIKESYGKLSIIYQKKKENNNIPLN